MAAFDCRFSCHRNIRFKSLRWCFKAELVAWSSINLPRDFVEARLRLDARELASGARAAGHPGAAVSGFGQVELNGRRSTITGAITGATPISLPGSKASRG